MSLCPHARFLQGGEHEYPVVVLHEKGDLARGAPGKTQPERELLYKHGPLCVVADETEPAIFPRHAIRLSEVVEKGGELKEAAPRQGHALPGGVTFKPLGKSWEGLFGQAGEELFGFSQHGERVCLEVIAVALRPSLYLW